MAWTEEASRWLDDIFEYIALETPEAARRVVLNIYEHAQVLEVHPEIGYRYSPLAEARKPLNSIEQLE